VSKQNPMGITGPAWAGNATQPDYRVPTANVTSLQDPLGNRFAITGPNAPPNATQPDYRTPAVDPHVASYPVGAKYL